MFNLIIYIMDGYNEVTTHYGFNHWETSNGPVKDNDETFILKNGTMISLGTFEEAKHRVPYGTSKIVGKDGTTIADYAEGGTRLFIRDYSDRLRT